MSNKKTAKRLREKLEQNKVSGVGNRKKLQKEYIALRKKELGMK